MRCTHLRTLGPVRGDIPNVSGRQPGPRRDRRPDAGPVEMRGMGPRIDGMTPGIDDMRPGIDRMRDGINRMARRRRPRITTTAVQCNAFVAVTLRALEDRHPAPY